MRLEVQSSLSVLVSEPSGISSVDNLPTRNGSPTSTFNNYLPGSLAASVKACCCSSGAHVTQRQTQLSTSFQHGHAHNMILSIMHTSRCQFHIVECICQARYVGLLYKCTYVKHASEMWYCIMQNARHAGCQANCRQHAGNCENILLRHAS